jgi:hypothetical protein
LEFLADAAVLGKKRDIKKTIVLLFCSITKPTRAPIYEISIALTLLRPIIQVFHQSTNSGAK